MYELTVPYSGETTFFTEMQVNKKLSDNLSGIVRVETRDFDKDNTTYLAGLRYDL